MTRWIEVEEIESLRELGVESSSIEPEHHRNAVELGRPIRSQLSVPDFFELTGFVQTGNRDLHSPGIRYAAERLEGAPDPPVERWVPCQRASPVEKHGTVASHERILARTEGSLARLVTLRRSVAG